MPATVRPGSPQASKRPRVALFQPLRASPAFTTLWLGQSLSRLGDSVLFVILPIVVYQVFRSTVDMGVVLTAYTLPQVAMLPVAGLLVDRLPRVRLMQVADILRMLATAFVTVLLIRGALTLPALVAVAALFGVMDAVFLPAYAAVRAQIFTEDIRNAANALTGMTQQVAQIVGPALGGLVLAVASPAAGFAFDGATYLVSAVSLFLLTVPPVRREGASEGFLQGMKGGLATLRSNAWLWQTILAFALINVASGGLAGILVPWLIKVRLVLPSADYGLAMAGMAVGSLVVASVFGQRRSWRHRGPVAYGGVAVQGAAYAALAFVHAFPLIVLLLAAAGAGMVLFSLIWEGSLQELVPAHAYGRVASLDMFGSFALLPVGYLATGWFAQAVGGITALWAAGALTVGLSLAMLLSPAIRRFS